MSLSCGPHKSSSIGVAALGFPWHIEALILIFEKVLNCRYGLIIGPILLPSLVLFHVREQKNNSQMVPAQENMEGDQPGCNGCCDRLVQEHCPGETGLP